MNILRNNYKALGSFTFGVGIGFIGHKFLFANQRLNEVSFDGSDCPFNVQDIAPNHFNAYLARINEIKKSHPDNIAMQVFDPSYFNSLDETKKLRLLRCVNSGVQNPDSEMGAYAMTPNDYDDLKPFFQKAIETYHKVDLTKTKHTNTWDLTGVEGLPKNGKLDITE